MKDSTTASLPQPVLDWVGDVVTSQILGTHAAVTEVRRLVGATSSHLYRLAVGNGTTSLDLVLRLYTNREWLEEEPDVVHHEARNLKIVRAADVPTPELIAHTATIDSLGVPALLMTAVSGTVVLTPWDLEGWLRQMAEAALAVHRINLDAYPWHYAPYNDINTLQVPAWSSCPDLWARAIEIVQGPVPSTRRCFIHRDYHPNNVLWSEPPVTAGQGADLREDGGTSTGAFSLSGIVDWPNACLGPPGVDVAWCRSNLAASHGLAVADRFLEIYCALAGADFVYDPFWDLMVIIEDLPGPPEIYPPWVDYGVRGLTSTLMLKRQDAYLKSVLARYDRV